MKTRELIERTTMHIVKYGRNLDRVGLTDGYMVVQFRGKTTTYIYGADVPQEELGKLLRSPFPDALFTNNIRDKFQCFKVEHAN